MARKQFPMPWPAETLDVFAPFSGRPAINVNLDMPATRLMEFWCGTLQWNCEPRRLGVIGVVASVVPALRDSVASPPAVLRGGS
jgi:hypothetical protein